MIATLKFKLPEEKGELLRAQNGAKYISVLHEHEQWLRSQLKYNCELSEEHQKGLQAARDNLWEAINGSGINMDEELS